MQTLVSINNLKVFWKERVCSHGLCTSFLAMVMNCDRSIANVSLTKVSIPVKPLSDRYHPNVYTVMSVSPCASAIFRRPLHSSDTRDSNHFNRLFASQQPLKPSFSSNFDKNDLKKFFTIAHNTHPFSRPPTGFHHPFPTSPSLNRDFLLWFFDIQSGHICRL